MLNEVPARSANNLALRTVRTLYMLWVTKPCEGFRQLDGRIIPFSVRGSKRVSSSARALRSRPHLDAPPEHITQQTKPTNRYHYKPPE